MIVRGDMYRTLIKRPENGNDGEYVAMFGTKKFIYNFETGGVIIKKMVI